MHVTAGAEGVRVGEIARPLPLFLESFCSLFFHSLGSQRDDKAVHAAQLGRGRLDWIPGLLTLQRVLIPGC